MIDRVDHVARAEMSDRVRDELGLGFELRVRCPFGARARDFESSHSAAGAKPYEALSRLVLDEFLPWNQVS